MITNYKIKLKNSRGERFVYHWGYQLYGMLMNEIDPEYGETLHTQGLTPVSQYMAPASIVEGLWSVSLFGDEAESRFTPILEGPFSIKDGMKLSVLSCETITINTTREMMARASDKFAGNRFSIYFDTPTSFKTDNNYALFPTVPLIVKGLVGKWNAFSKDSVLEDEDLLNMLTDGLRISGYRLQSSFFHMKGIKIPGFTGRVDITARLAEPVMEIWRLLMYFGGYSGVGIKTSLGMGGARFETWKGANL